MLHALEGDADLEDVVTKSPVKNYASH